MSDLSDLDILLVGFDSLTESALDSRLEECRVAWIKVDTRIIRQAIKPRPSLVICQRSSADISAAELGQLLRTVYPEEPIFYLCREKAEFDRTILIKNGFSDAFLLPMDSKLLTKGFEEAVSKITQGDIQSFQPVKVLDLKAGDILDFDLYLYFSLNKRYMKFTRAGDAIDGARLNRLLGHELGTAYVEASQMSLFNRYASQNSQSLKIISGIGITGKLVTFQETARSFMSKLMSLSDETTVLEGKAYAKQCHAIINEYIIGPISDPNYRSLVSWQAELNDPYLHAANVALFSSLLIQQILPKSIEDVALAGLLHDIGIPNLDSSTSDRSSALYRRHPDSSVNFIRTRKIDISRNTLVIIQQHEERIDGSGFPRAMKGNQIGLEAQALGLIDELDERIATRAGEARISAGQAIRAIADSGHPKYSREIIGAALKLLREDQAHV